jgi:hypothetical protein
MDAEIDHLATALGLPRDRAVRLLEEARTVFHETLPAFVRGRHQEYKGRMRLRNDEIYRRIQEDVRLWRFRAPDLSLRQIRRMIHG